MRGDREDQAYVLVFVCVLNSPRIGGVGKSPLKLRDDLSDLQMAREVIGAHQAGHREYVYSVVLVQHLDIGVYECFAVGVCSCVSISCNRIGIYFLRCDQLVVKVDYLTRD